MSKENENQDDEFEPTGGWVTVDLGTVGKEEDDDNDTDDDNDFSDDFDGESDDGAEDDGAPKEKDSEPKKKSRAQERIRQLVKERKEWESKFNEAQAKLAQAENSSIEARKESLTNQEKRIDDALKALRSEKRRALEDGDIDKQLELDDKIQDLMLDKRIVAGQVSKLPEKTETKAPKEDKDVPQIPEDMAIWLEENTWAVRPANREERKKVMLLKEISNELIREGYSEFEPDFFEKIDEELEKRFGSNGGNDVELESKDKDTSASDQGNDEKQPVKRKKQSPVSGSSRTPASKKGKSPLSPEERAFVRKMGITEERYTYRKERAEKDRQETGWVTIV